jgi:lipopolysaccharide assembly outer membrane protein LptD (OstA)
VGPSQIPLFNVKISLLLSGLFSGAFALAVAGCGRNSEQTSAQVVQNVARQKAKEAGENLTGLKSATMQGATLSGGDSQGRPLWSVSAANVSTDGTLESGSPKQATLTDAKAILYRAGKPESSIKAVEMKLYTTPKGVRLVMSKGVIGESSGPWTGNKGTIKFAAPRADVDVQGRVLNASGGVSMSQGALKVVGQTMRARTSLQRIDVSGKVRGNGKKGQIEADTATYDWQKSTLVAKKVVARQQGTQLSGDTLTANTEASTGTLIGRVVAKSDQGTANAPRLDFNWDKDRIVANTATFEGKDGKLRADRLQTDSKLRVASASGVVVEKDGATLRAAFVDGFEKFTRISGHGVSFKRGDMSLTAPRADATKRGNSWLLVASGGARGQSAEGTVNASQVTWDEGGRRVKANGGVTMQKDGATLSGNSLDSDTEFVNATLRGNVRGRMKEGSTLSAGSVEKRGERFYASNGATARFQTKSTGVLTLTAAKLEAASDGSTATATGGVTVKSATGATARAPRATYDRKSQKVTATGGVDFYDPTRGFRQRGDKLVADLALKEARLSNPSGQVSPKTMEGIKLF